MGATTDLAKFIGRVQDGLAGRAFLFDNPNDYQAGVEDAIDAMTRGADIQFDAAPGQATLEQTLKLRLAH
ncbi:MAG: hypothetical protein LC722_00190 [Actinobacteria bacterium]|nr:hypothetical protein [Actinomycetota bacterium]